LFVFVRAIGGVASGEAAAPMILAVCSLTVLGIADRTSPSFPGGRVQRRHARS
jgi:hypothetical protein